MTDEDDPHPDDVEAERLLALVVAELRAPEGEKDMGRYLDLQAHLRALHRPVEGIDCDLPSTAILSDAIITPGDLLAPRSPWLREVGTSRVTPEGIEIQSITIPDPEAVARAALSVKDKSSDSKRLAGQLVAHHVLYQLPLPDEVMQALAVALGLHGKRVNTPARYAAEAAYEAIGRELTAEAFHAVIVALGLTNADGALRQQVIEKLRPGQRFGVRGDSRADYLRAVEAEVDTRDDWGDWRTQGLPQLEIAYRLGWDHIGTIRHWTASQQWAMDTMSRAFWKAKRMRAAIDIEARAVVQRIDPPDNATLAALIGGEALVVNWWRIRPDWSLRVRARAEMMLAADEAARSHGEEILARQAARALSRESN